jgi:hypothetical protein
MKKIIIISSCLSILLIHSASGMEHHKSLWTPETVIGVGGALVGIKLMHDGLQKMANPNRQSFSLSRWKLFSENQGGRNTVTLQFPQATVVPPKITFKFKRLNAEEISQEFKEGVFLFGCGALSTFAGIYFIQNLKKMLMV